MKFLNNNIEAVIFDMDGVLIDSYNTHKEALEIVAAEYGFKATENDFVSLFGKTGFEGMRTLNYCEGWSDEKILEFCDKQDAMFRKIFKKNPLLIEGSLEFAEKLFGFGIPIAIGTSAPKENVEIFFDSLNIHHLFKNFISCDDVSKGKPDPEIFIKCAELINKKPESCLVFEDSLMGVEAGKAAKAFVIALSTTHKETELTKADYIINHFKDEKLNKIITF
jgi:beta-phosphoglucomutase-like phosphatase (HAD superfamily)